LLRTGDVRLHDDLRAGTARRVPVGLVDRPHRRRGDDVACWPYPVGVRRVHGQPPPGLQEDPQHSHLSPGGAELRVSTLELFFDLVFVFTITQLTSLLARELWPTGVAQVLLIFSVLFWMYSGYAWLTNRVPPVSTTRRLLLVAGMAGFFICALAI